MFRFLGVFLYCFSLGTSEPVCSRFHYEEQTLRKMIMVEMLVEKFQAELSETIKSVNDALEELKTERKEIRKEVTQLQSTVESHMENHVNDSASEEVLFLARNIRNLSPSQGETLVFETAVTNIGSGYDITTGKFTAPVRGMYMFSVQLCLDDKKYLHVEIVKDDISLSKSVNNEESGEHRACYTSVVPAYINAGASVWVKTGRSVEAALWENEYENWNIFSGVLLH